MFSCRHLEKWHVTRNRAYFSTSLCSRAASEVKLRPKMVNVRKGVAGGRGVAAVGRGWKGTKTGQGRAAHIFPLLCFYSSPLRLTGNALRCFRERFLLQEKLSRLIIKPENRRVVGHDRARFFLMLARSFLFHCDTAHCDWWYSFIKYSILFTFWGEASLLVNAAPRVALITHLLRIVSLWNNCPWFRSCAPHTPALLVHWY